MGKWPVFRLFEIAFGIGVTAGAMFTALDLRNAIRESDALYTSTVRALSLEGDLEYWMQESRRTFLYALATTDPNEQLPHVDACRQADQKVEALLIQLRRTTGFGDYGREAEDFDRAWLEYLRLKDEVIALVLEGNTREAVSIDLRAGAEKFQQGALALRHLKARVDRAAAARVSNVRAAFVRSGLQLILLFLGVVSASLALAASLSAKNRAVDSLRKANEQLSLARRLDQERSDILEMVGRNQPLDAILDKIAHTLDGLSDGAAGIVGLVREDRVKAIRSRSLQPRICHKLEAASNLAGDFSGVADALASAAASEGFSQASTVPIQSSSGSLIGWISVWERTQPANHERTAVLDSANRLAALAVGHRQYYERLSFQAEHDILTGIPNRLLFHQRVTERIDERQRCARGCAAILWIDLDRFKQVNDLLGHHVGDALLQLVAQRICACVRSDDTVARIGGDEFAVLLSEPNERSDAEALAHRILEALAVPARLCGHEVSITSSIGISFYPEHGASIMALLRNADAAMYQAKKNGMNAYRVFEAAGEIRTLRLLEIEAQLRTALNRGEFWLAFHPQVTVDGGVVGLEALLRWDNPTLGTVSPAEFIPVAEERGLIVPLGKFVLDEACRQGAEWQAAGHPPVRLSVNVSAVQFAQPDFAQDVRDALHHSGLAPECLELELTESVLLHNVEESVTQMERIREMGVSIAIDDFGTGYSSLSILRRLPVNCVKIDRSFVWAAECESDGAATMIRSIVNLAHSFGLRVVAEGVQTQQQLEILRSTGADVLQGFLFHQPVPAASIGSILGDRSAAVSAVAKSLDSMHRVIAREDEKAGAQCSPGATLRST